MRVDFEGRATYKLQVGGIRVGVICAVVVMVVMVVGVVSVVVEMRMIGLLGGGVGLNALKARQ